MELLDHLQTTIVIIVVEDVEQLAESITVACADNHEDLDEVLIGEIGRESRNCISEGKCPNPIR